SVTFLSLQGHAFTYICPAYCGAAMSTGHALRRCDDKIYCNAAHTSYFMQVSSLCLAKAQMCRACSPPRGDMLEKDSRMKYHGTASAFSIAPYRVSRLFCPQCKDLIIAATKSQHVSTHEVRHWWACEACGHEFRTTVRWQSSFVQSMSAADSAMA